MRRPFIAGNWKMNKQVADAGALASELKALVGGVTAVEVAVCPTFIHLSGVLTILRDSNIGVGAQNAHWESGGAYTGEIAPAMLKDLGCLYVILGHSERRALFNETSGEVNQKLHAALAAGLTAIVCVGETLAEREAGATDAVVTKQVHESLAGLTDEQMTGSVIAYEPVWAIGTGKTATPDQAQQVHAMIRGLLAEQFSPEVAQAVRIQYGGSVKPNNVKELMAQADIDGALVGGASLDAESFRALVQYNG